MSARIRLGNLWLNIAQIYGRDITKAALSLMLDSIADLDPREVERVLHDWAGKSKLNRHPSPAEVRELVCPEADPKHLAVEAAARVVAAVAKFGWNNLADAREYIGALGWRAVERLGGWQYLCENLGVTLQVTTVQAQVRDLCLATNQLAAAGIDDQPIGLPTGKVAEIVNQTAERLSLNKGDKGE